MIGGRVPDRTVLVALARQTSIDAAAMVRTAVEEAVVLLVATSAAALARSAVSTWTASTSSRRPERSDADGLLP